MLDDTQIKQANLKPPVGAQALRQSVVVIPGDGIGPEVVEATQRVLSAACPALDWIVAEGGAAPMERGVSTGLPQETIDAIEATGLVLKGPMATPMGYGGKSANVTLRKMFELFGNIRPIRSLPGVASPYADRDINFTIVRENVEDLYAGIEHMQTPDVAQCLKLITRTGSAKISQLAFEVAQAEGRKSLHCVTKSNIMKLTEGLFQSAFEQIAKDHSGIKTCHMLVDNCAQQMVLRPEQFETLVTTNMNGDILSDLAAGLVGGLGLAPSANIGAGAAMFEAVHGTAPQIAGKGVANPTALILAGAMMLRHIGLNAQALRIEAAVNVVYKKGIYLTADIAKPGQGVSTNAFADAVIDAHDRIPLIGGGDSAPLRSTPVSAAPKLATAAQREFDGLDIFVEWSGDAAHLASMIETLADDTAFKLKMISNRGTIMWPVSGPGTDTVPHWRCRMIPRAGAKSAEARVPAILEKFSAQLRWMHVEKLESLNGTPGYSRAQGEN